MKNFKLQTISSLKQFKDWNTSRCKKVNGKVLIGKIRIFPR